MTATEVVLRVALKMAWFIVPMLALVGIALPILEREL